MHGEASSAISELEQAYCKLCWETFLSFQHKSDSGLVLLGTSRFPLHPYVHPVCDYVM